MQGIPAPCGKRSVNSNQILHRRNFCRNNYTVRSKTKRLGPLRAAQRGLDNSLMHDGACIFRDCRTGVFIHQAGQQILVERSPVDTNPDRFCVLQRSFYDLRELTVFLIFEADVTRIYAVLVECLCTSRVIAQKPVAIVMEVADERHRYALPLQRVMDVWNRLGRLFTVDSNPDQF